MLKGGNLPSAKSSMKDMKKILISFSIIGVVGAVVIGATVAYFNDTETSSGNIFTAGTLDLKVDHIFASYNGSPCNCEETGNELVINGGFETPDVPTGGWAVFPDASQTSWTVESGAGLEIQDHAAGTPHGGNQLAELDSNNSSAISQMISTVAGKQYRLTLWYSPRPNVPAGDNTIGVTVKVTSGGVTVIDDIIGASSAGGSDTSWQKITYNFVATDASTKIMFSDMGNYNNSYGGYLDDISVKEFVCGYPTGGTCTLWDLKDLGAGDYYWHYGPDMKPGDYGTNIISLHAYDNDAYACIITHNIQDLENTLVEPELALSDTALTGELSQFIKLFAWEDTNQNNSYDVEEAVLLPVNSLLTAAMNPAIALTASSTKYIGLAWCFGTQSLNGNTISCSGTGNQDIAQTDIMNASITAYIEQQRNNEGFNCANVTLP